MQSLTDKRMQVNEYGLLYVVLCAWAYILICRPQDLLTFMIPIRPGMVIIIILLLCCLIENPLKSILPICKNIQVKQYLLLFLVMVTSIIFSYYSRASFNFVIYSYSQAVLFFLIFIVVVKDFKQLENIIFLCCCGIAMYSLVYMLKGSTIVDRISYGEMYDPNDMAYVAISFVMFNFYFFVKTVPYRSVIALANIVVSLVLILSTGSRGGLVAGLLASAMLFVSRRVGVAGVLKVLLVLSLVVFISTTGRNFSRFNTLFSLKDDYNISAEEGRVQIWQTGVKIMLSHPLTGVGVQCFPEALGKERELNGADSIKWQTAHNSLILIGAETGIIGLLLYSILSFRTFSLFNLVRKESFDSQLIRMSELAFIGFAGNFIASMFISQSYSIIWVFYIALSVVLAKFYARNISTNASVN